MTQIHLNHDNVKPFITGEEILGLQSAVDGHHRLLESGGGPGADYLGWLHLPSRTEKKLVDEINGAADSIRGRCDTFISIGIGGSYLGARAGIEFVRPLLGGAEGTAAGPEILFAGQNISSDYLADLLDRIEEREVCLNVISKSGTTTEPAIAFRILKQWMEKRQGPEESRRRIFVTTDRQKGALKTLASAEGYKTFVIPDDVGGRYSVLTPVGLLPMAVAGIDIQALLDGASACESATSASSRLEENPAYLYAAIRHLLYRKGKWIEILASFHPGLGSILEWWKQLAGESEGKESRGIFPASVQYTTDLHSMGQWVQEGNRILFETFLLLESSNRTVTVPAFENDADGLNYLAGKSLDYVNGKAYEGTAMAHRDGGVPNMTLILKDRRPATLGRLFYFFERAIALSGYLLQVNPFDQPGVEYYKKNMFILLNKPGYGKGN